VVGDGRLPALAARLDPADELELRSYTIMDGVVTEEEVLVT
jgi:hypothetical protein